MNIAIRAASTADVPAMHRVRHKVQENRLSDPRQVIEASYLPYVAAGSAWVAESDGDVAGFAAIDNRSNCVWALFVDPAEEGAGVGRALHRRMVDWAQEHGISRLSLSTEKGTRAAEFYRRAGWEEAGDTAGGEILFVMTLRS